MANSATRKRTNFNNYDFDPEISGSSLSHTVKTTSVIDDNGEKQPGIVAETYADADQDTDAADADGGDMDYRDYTNAETYDPDVDYQALINDAVTDKNYVAAGLLENLRNMKIKGEEIADQGLTYAYHNPEVVVTDNGLTDSKGTYLDGMLDVLKEQYREALEANDAATAASVRQAIDKLNAQKEALQQQYDELAKQLYIDRRMGEKNLPQQLAAMGYSGGLTESSMLGLATSYQQALAENERSRAQGYTDIEQQIADAQLTGELSKAQTEQELAQNYFSNYASIAQQLQSQANWDKQFGYQQQQDEKSAQRTARQDALSLVAWMREMGFSEEELSHDVVANAVKEYLEEQVRLGLMTDDEAEQIAMSLYPQGG
jgi:hypothetical protein